MRKSAKKEPFVRVLDDLIKLAQRVESVREKLGVPPRYAATEFPPITNSSTGEDLTRAILAIIKEVQTDVLRLKATGRLAPGDLMTEMEELGKSLDAFQGDSRFKLLP